MLASAQVAAENEEAYARLYAAQALHDNKDSVAAADGAAAKYQIDPDLLPACMPSPDVLLQIMDSIFGAAGGGRPVADFTHLLLRVTLTMQALMGFVLLGGVVGAYFGHPELALTTAGICAMVSMPGVCMRSFSSSIQGAIAKVKTQSSNLIGFTKCSTRGYDVANIHMIHKDLVAYSEGIMRVRAGESLVLRFVDVYIIPVYKRRANQRGWQ